MNELMLFTCLSFSTLNTIVLLSASDKHIMNHCFSLSDINWGADLNIGLSVENLQSSERCLTLSDEFVLHND